MTFDPNVPGRKGTIFGYPYSLEEADLVLMPVPWDVTVSYGSGTAKAPQLILEESTQLDFSLPIIKMVYKYPVAMATLATSILQESIDLRAIAERIISVLEDKGELSEEENRILEEINTACDKMISYVRESASKYLIEGKIVGLIGGDHSTPLGLIQALGEIHDEFGILQIDAHMDLREAYEGFTYSHASIMKNALRNGSVSKLVQVGIRDYCEDEEELVKRLEGRVEVFFDEKIIRAKWNGENWPVQVERIIEKLPVKVYISFDMDGLNPSLCPNTGTPVAGGLSFHEAAYLIESVVRSGRTIIGFDISETGNGIWDANVAARILFRLCAFTGVSRGRLRLT